jgi:hypothetical protein
MMHPALAREQLDALVGLGCSVALDDFGTGYSSMAYLKALPVSAIKIDRGFIQDIPHDQSDAQISQSIIALAHGLGLSVVAEGVETEAQRQFLARHGCEVYQGWLFARAMPAEELEGYRERACPAAAGLTRRARAPKAAGGAAARDPLAWGDRRGGVRVPAARSVSPDCPAAVLPAATPSSGARVLRRARRRAGACHRPVVAGPAPAAPACPALAAADPGPGPGPGVADQLLLARRSRAERERMDQVVGQLDNTFQSLTLRSESVGALMMLGLNEPVLKQLARHAGAAADAHARLVAPREHFALTASMCSTARAGWWRTRPRAAR